MIVGVARLAAADPAGDQMKKGIDLYKAGKYADAAAALAESYKLAAKPETLFALAQAERLSGDCTSAARHYHQVIDQVSDFNVAKLVQQNLAMCEKDAPLPKPEPKPEPKAEPPPPAPPQIITKTVTRDVRHTDTLGVALVTAGALGLGAAAGLYVASHANHDAAAQARTLDESNKLQDRASSEQTAMFIAGGAGIAMLGVAFYRLTRGEPDQPDKPDVAVAPTQGGGAVWVTGRF